MPPPVGADGLRVRQRHIPAPPVAGGIRRRNRLAAKEPTVIVVADNQRVLVVYQVEVLVDQTLRARSLREVEDIDLLAGPAGIGIAPLALVPQVVTQRAP